MASITEYLNKILTAKKGEEVRSSIHDGIKAINEESASAQSTASSVKAAAAAAQTTADSAKTAAAAAQSTASSAKTAAAAAQSTADAAQKTADSAQTEADTALTEAYSAANSAADIRDHQLKSYGVDGADSAGAVWGYIPLVKTDGGIELGKYIDFHLTSEDGIDRYSRIMISSGEDQPIFTFSGSAYGKGAIIEADQVHANQYHGTYYGTLGYPAKITLNGVEFSYAATNSSATSFANGLIFYAPTSAGEENQILISGSEGKPAWSDSAPLATAFKTGKTTITFAQFYSAFSSALTTLQTSIAALQEADEQTRSDIEALQTEIKEGLVSGAIYIAGSVGTEDEINALTDFKRGQCYLVTSAAQISSGMDGYGNQQYESLDVNDLLCAVKDYDGDYASSNRKSGYFLILRNTAVNYSDVENIIEAVNAENRNISLINQDDNPPSEIIYNEEFTDEKILINKYSPLSVTLVNLSSHALVLADRDGNKTSVPPYSAGRYSYYDGEFTVEGQSVNNDFYRLSAEETVEGSLLPDYGQRGAFCALISQDTVLTSFDNLDQGLGGYIICNPTAEARTLTVRNSYYTGEETLEASASVVIPPLSLNELGGGVNTNDESVELTLKSSSKSDALGGYGIGGAESSGAAWGYIPIVKSDGGIEIGKYIDFHLNSDDGIDRYARVMISSGEDQPIFTFSGSSSSEGAIIKADQIHAGQYHGTYYGSLGYPAKVTLNGTQYSYAATNASATSFANGLKFYAPTSAGAENQILIAGSDGKPVWSDTAPLATAFKTGDVTITLAQFYSAFTSALSALQTKNAELESRVATLETKA